MSFAACLAKLQAEGKIDAERVYRFGAEYDRLLRAYRKTMGHAAAVDLASRDTLAGLDFQALQDRRTKAMQISTQLGLLDGLRDHLEAGGNAGQFAIATMDHHEAVRGLPSVENTRGALFKLAWARMDGFLGRYNRDLLGRVRHVAELDDIVRALRGETVENVSAREAAAAIGDTFEWLRQQFNAAGGAIARLDNWGLPQNHDALAIGEAGFAEWHDFIRPLLNAGEMIDNTTGKPFVGDEALDEALEKAWRNITSHGMDGQIPGSFSGTGKLANQRSDHRFLVFNDADAWLAYNRRFGTGDVFDAITGHIDSMTRDIAAMQVLGPNPAHTIRWLRDVLNQDALPTVEGGKTPKLEKSAAKGAGAMERMWDYYSGALTMVAPEDRARARFFSGVRNWNVASKLGSAFISALPSDPIFKGLTAKFNGLPVVKDFGEYLATFNPADASHRAMAEHAGLVFSDMIQRGERMWHEGRGLNVHELTRRAGDAVMRGTFLTPHTVASKQSLGLSFMKDWADNAGTAFDQLAEPKRLSLERYGIGPVDWDRLRAIGASEQGLLRPGDLARSDDPEALASAIKFFSLIDSEVRFGIPGESLRAQTAVATIGGAVRIKRGTWGGELLHSTNQFKTYSVIMMMTHMQRALYGRGGMNRAAYAATLPIFLTIGGMLSNSFFDILNGKDPAPLDKPLTWARAFARSGGMGIAGDIMTQGLADDRGTGGAVAGFVLGPTLSSIVEPAVSLTLGNIGDKARRELDDKPDNEDIHLAAQLVRQARQAVPGSNAWYGRLAFNRLVGDQLQEIADPKYRQSWRRMERAAREQGTGFYWEPGDIAPDRAPDLRNLFDAAPPASQGSLIQ